MNLSAEQSMSCAPCFDLQRFTCWMLLLAVVALGSWLRVRDLTDVPTWWDEHVSVFAASGVVVKQGDRLQGRVSLFDETEAPRVAEILPERQGVKAGRLESSIRVANIPAATLFWDRGNSLAFAFLLNAWTGLFGFSDSALRALPCLLGMLAIPAIYLLASALFSSRWAALLSAFLVSINALLIRYSQEVRSYSLAVLLSLLATWFFVLAWKASGRRQAALIALYVGSITLLWFSHYLAGPVLTAAHFLAALSCQKPRAPLAIWLAGSLFAFVALSVWMLWGAALGFAAMGEHDRVWLARAIEGNVTWLKQFTWREAANQFVQTTSGAIMPYIIVGQAGKPLEMAVLAGMLVSFVGGLWITARKGGRTAISAIILCGVLALGTTLAVYLAWKSGHTLPFIRRYQTFYVCYQIILLSVAFVALAGEKRVVAWLGVALMLTGFVQSGKANLRTIFDERKESKFSMDNFLREEIRAGATRQTIVCRTLDSALIAGLKAARLSPDTVILLDKAAPEEISILPQGPK